MTTPSQIRRTSVGLLLAVAVAVTACTSSTAAPPTTSTTTTSSTVPSAALTRVRASVAATTGAGTAQFQSVSSTGAGSGAHPTVVTMTGSISFRGPDVSSTNTVHSAAAGSSTPSEVHSLYFGATGTVYLSPGPDGPWQRSISHVPFAYLAPITPGLLRSATGPVTVLGPAVIGGVPTTGYAVPVPARTQRTSETGTATRVRSAPFVARVWLDADGRIVRTTGTVHTTVEPGGSSYTETETTTLSAFGTPVSITPPTTATPA